MPRGIPRRNNNPADKKSRSFVFTLDDLVVPKGEKGGPKDKDRIEGFVTMCFFDYAGIFNTVTFVAFLNLILCLDKPRVVHSSLELLYKTKTETVLHPLLYTQAGDEAVKCFTAERTARMKNKKEDMPEIRYDGTAPILFSRKTFTVLKDDRDQYLCLSLFNRNLANKHALPNTLTIRIPEREQHVTGVINAKIVSNKGMCII